jgi:hypothetical protein
MEKCNCKKYTYVVEIDTECDGHYICTIRHDLKRNFSRIKSIRSKKIYNSRKIYTYIVEIDIECDAHYVHLIELSLNRDFNKIKAIRVKRIGDTEDKKQNKEK